MSGRRRADPPWLIRRSSRIWVRLVGVADGDHGRVRRRDPREHGRAVDGALFLLEAIAFVTIVTAVITSSFVERARREGVAELETEEAVGIEQLTAQLAEITSRLERLQQTVDGGGSAGARTTPS